MSKKAKNIISIIAIVLIAVLFVGMLSWFTHGFRKWKDDEPKKDEAVALDSSGNSLYNNNTYKLSSNMTFLSATSLEGITLEATVLPLNATDKKVDWSVEWVNPSFSWATDKTVTDYVTITPNSDGSNLAAVNCLNDNGFSTQIKITVSLRKDNSVNAVCTVDFQQRYLGYDFSMTKPTGSGEEGEYFEPGEPFLIDIMDLFESRKYCYTFVDTNVTDGTLPIIVYPDKVYVRFGTQFWEFLKVTFNLEGDSPASEYSLSIGIDCNSKLKSLKASAGGNLASITLDYLIDTVIANFIETYPNIPILEFDITISCSNVGIVESNTYDIYFYNSAVNATSVTLDKDNIVI